MRRKNCLILIAWLLAAKTGWSQQPTFSDTALLYFNEVRKVTGKNKSLWGIDLYAPLLFVNPISRQVYANYPDSAGTLKTEKGIYSGILPLQVNISNTALHWCGKHWAMVMLPLPKDPYVRNNLLTHELFHRAQKRLGFFASNPDNNHLDKKDGRIYLRLELEALRKAVLASEASDIRQHIRAALLFRTVRHAVFAGADSTENLMELNEGICEYTGLLMSGRNSTQIKESITRRIDNFITTPSYVRAFAYETIPVYGYLLSELNKDWNKKIDNRTRLTDYFKKAFSINLPVALVAETGAVGNEYLLTAIIKEETDREERINKQLTAYRLQFLDSAHVELPLQNMNMSFDYTKMVVLDNKGTVYPTIRITDNWGILDVTKGALISPNWNQVNISYPTKIEAQKINGDGWSLELKPGFVLQKDTAGRNYILSKQ